MKSCSIVPYEESIREFFLPREPDSSRIPVTKNDETCIILRYIRLLQCIVHCIFLWLQPLPNKHKYFSCTKYFPSHLAFPLDMQYTDSFGFISVLTLRAKTPSNTSHRSNIRSPMHPKRTWAGLRNGSQGTLEEFFWREADPKVYQPQLVITLSQAIFGPCTGNQETYDIC